MHPYLKINLIKICLHHANIIPLIILISLCSKLNTDGKHITYRANKLQFSMQTVHTVDDWFPFCCVQTPGVQQVTLFNNCVHHIQLLLKISQKSFNQ